ncbi:acyl-CoA synthetase [Victivallis sp. Marseille-Q1083]|uniref:acyl-CoA synthetase n=1 Tax=Victivallis sp. Marseille-Q1083 TaxID=2717288 RepID=UPI00158C3C3A|nr:AMP-binding protein [Victivallis sp. Marseille-Q1083]
MKTEESAEANASGSTLRSQFPVEVPDIFNFGYDVIDRWAQHDRNKLAMIWVNQQGAERKYTFNDFSKLSNQAANLLLKVGITKGDRVFLMLPRIPEWWIFSLALIKLGAVLCPTPVLLTPADLQQRIQVGKFKMVITDLENAPKFDEIFEECPSLQSRLVVDGQRADWISYPAMLDNPSRLSRHEVKTPFRITTRREDPLLILFTSGTSKTPKMVLHSIGYSLAHRITAQLWHGLTSDDLHFSLTDTGWGKNLWGNFFGQWLIGCCVFIYDIRGKFHPDEILPLLEKYEITSFCAPPTVYRMLVLADLTTFDFKELRQCTAAGESLQTETIRLWREGTGLELREGYGQSETVCMIANFVDIPDRPGSIGKAAPGWEIELHDDDGKPVATGEEGRIAVKMTPQPPYGLLTKYLNPEENEKSFVAGYYYTGDKARIDEDGYYWFIGRSDDIIKSSGYRIGPQEVEEVLMQHPAVNEVGVIGVPDPLRGAKVKAYIVLNPGFEPTDSMVKELQKHSKQLTAPYKYPREIEFVKILPKTFSGKIRRDLLRRHATTGENNWG